MGWETRKRGSRYYVRQRKIGGRLYREYIGGGESGELAAQRDKLEQLRCLQERKVRKVERQTDRTRERALIDYCGAVRERMEAVLVKAGCYKHRGQWRRGMAEEKKQSNVAALTSQQLFDQANTGDPAALSLLRKRTVNDPDTADSLMKIGNLFETARDVRFNQMFGNDLLGGLKLAVRSKMDKIVKDLVGDNSTPLEMLLAERIAMCWLDVQDNEVRYASLPADSKQIAWRSKLLERANHRYLSALKTLATVRRLQLPALQVNIAEQQINTTAALPDPSKIFPVGSHKPTAAV